jgi:L-arabinose isomerase
LSFSIGKVALGLEGDLPTMTCLLILALLSGEPVLFGEYLNFDKVENVTVLHHTGAQYPGLADDRWSPVVTSDLEYSSSSNRFRGATLELAARPGRVTILSLLAARDRFIMVAAGGESLGGPPRIPGSPHVIFRPDLPLEEYFRRATQAGIGHHCAVVHGDFRPQVQALSRMLQVEHVSIG